MAEQSFLKSARSGLGKIVPRSSFQIGLVLIFVTLIAGWGLFNKDKIMTTVASGSEVTIQFDRQYRLKPFNTRVKIAGVPIGKVTDVEYEDGVSFVTVKVNKGDLDKMGTMPEAEIRPATLLGGTVYIDIIPGNLPGDTTPAGEKPGHPADNVIPLHYTEEQAASVPRCAAERQRAQNSGVVEPCDRTHIPVELDRVLDVVTEDAQAGLQASIVDSNGILQNGGTEAFEGLLDTAPSALPPTGDILSALNGQDSQDLERAIEDLAAVVRAVEGDGTQVDALLDGAVPVAETLGQEADALGAAIDDLPRTATNARAALSELNELLNALDATAPTAVPVANELSELLTNLRPVLTDARPVVADLRAVTADLTPALSDLGPMTADARDIVDDVDGDVIERVRNPILTTLNEPAFDSSVPLYQELGYVIPGVNGFTATMDGNGRYQNFSAAVATETLSLPGILDASQLNQAAIPERRTENCSTEIVSASLTGCDYTIHPTDPTPAPVVVPTTIPADNVLSTPPSSVPDGTVGQDAGNPSAGGPGLGGPEEGDPYDPDGLLAEPSDPEGPIDTETAASLTPADHDNSPWRIPILAIVAIAALVGWMLAYDVYRKGTSA